MDGRRVLITGGGSGIGAALAEACVNGGARVGIIGRDKGRLARVADRTGAATAAADITIRAQVEAAVASIATELDGIDALVNNAGAMLHSRISAGLAEDWEQMLDVNVLGLLHVTYATLEHLRAARYADIVNLSSIAADRVSLPDFAIYAATKASVARISEALRSDIGKDRDIRVAVIKPGTTRTDGFGPGVRDARLREQVETTKLKSGMEPSELAAQICHVIAAPRSVCIEEMVVMPHRPV